ncbi:MAG: hypothetical protein HY271_07160 [Deltaproteobacteria bacterium]|nr:hypothetical protein [Deltaproteobacteria bacterium]
MRALGIWMASALLVVASCGGGGGGHSDPGGPLPVSTLTPTPLATATPVPTVDLVLTLTASIDVAAASFSVGYEAGRGTFTGSGAQTQCHLASADTLAVNDDDAGMLRVAMLPADPLQKATLALPTTLTCSFDEVGGVVTTAGLRVGSKKVGVIDASGVVVEGDASRLDVH